LKESERYFWEIIERLEVIVDEPYDNSKSEENHKTFAMALKYILLHMVHNQ